MARQTSERTRLRWALRPSPYKITARQGGWHHLGQLEIGPTDHFEGISDSQSSGQTRSEMAWTHHRSHLANGHAFELGLLHRVPSGLLQKFRPPR